LHGDLASYAEIESLKGHWLMIPLQPGLSPEDIFSSNLDMWQIFPPSMVSLTGECNKIGVSYTSFRNQPNACDQQIGSCLSNQIYHLTEQDAKRASEGLKPLYSIQRYGGGSQNVDQIQSVKSGLSLKLPMRQTRTSILTATISADNLQFVTNLADGKIGETKVCTFDGIRCGSFEAIAGTGYLHITIQNLGKLGAMFRVSIINCSTGILPILEQQGAIQPEKDKIFTFELLAETDIETNCSCTAIVKNVAGEVMDSTVFHFMINKTDYEPNPEQSDLDDKVSFHSFFTIVFSLHTLGRGRNPLVSIIL